MQKGVVVLTGSLELGKAAEEFPALFRRAACICLIGALEKNEVAQYCSAFLKAFLQFPKNSWDAWTQKVADMDAGGRAWSIDSLQQYLMKRITKAADSGL